MGTLLLGSARYTSVCLFDTTSVASLSLLLVVFSPTCRVSGVEELVAAVREGM
jgi:hypothetical protein